MYMYIANQKIVLLGLLEVFIIALDRQDTIS